MSREPALPPAPTPFGAAVLYPDVYPWYVLMATLDLLLTGLVLHFDGYEVNPIAHWVIVRFDWYGLVAYKYALVLLVILICEVVGRARTNGARRLAEWTVAVTAIPVVVALTLLYYKLYVEEAEWTSTLIQPQ